MNLIDRIVINQIREAIPEDDRAFARQSIVPFRGPRPEGIDPVKNSMLDRLDHLVNATVMSRQAFYQKMLDPRRSIDDECGYPSSLNGGPYGVEIYEELYARESVANRVVQVYPKETWQVQPSVYEVEDPAVTTRFEKAWNELGTRLCSGPSWYKGMEGSPVWEYLLRADILSGIGHFGILLLGIDDGLSLEQPVVGSVTANTVRYAQQEIRLVTNAENPDQQDEVVVNTHPVVNLAYVDSPINDSEYANLLALPNLTDNEKSVVEAWKTGRDNYVNLSDPVRNASGWGQVSFDKQYAAGFGALMPGSLMTGTDQQYFGIQFGPSQFPTEVPTGEHKLLFMRPYPEYLVQIVRYEWNVRNPRFGLPVMYRVTLNDPREQHSGVGLPLATVFVHWTRVVHLADNLGSSEIFGVPRMRPVLNRLLDLRKLYGGSAEMYWRGAFPGLAFETHPELGGDVEVDHATTKDMMENYMNGLQRYLTLTGMRARSIAPQVVDPTPQINVQLEGVCIQLGVPKRVFSGSERGQLASSQDDATWNDRLRERQRDYVTPRIIVTFVDRLIFLGVLPKPLKGYKVDWPDLTSQSDKEKAIVAVGRTKAMSQYPLVAPYITELDFYTLFLGYSEAEAQAMIDHREEDPYIPPVSPMGLPGAAGGPGTTPPVPGTPSPLIPGVPAPVPGLGNLPPSLDKPIPEFGRRGAEQRAADDFQGDKIN